TAGGFGDEAAPRDSATGINAIAVHFWSPDVNKLIQIEEQPRQALQSFRIAPDVSERLVLLPRARRASDNDLIPKADGRPDVPAGFLAKPVGQLHGCLVNLRTV